MLCISWRVFDFIRIRYLNVIMTTRSLINSTTDPLAIPNVMVTGHNKNMIVLGESCGFHGTSAGPPDKIVRPFFELIMDPMCC